MDKEWICALSVKLLEVSRNIIVIIIIIILLCSMYVFTKLAGIALVVLV